MTKDRGFFAGTKELDKASLINLGVIGYFLRKKTRNFLLTEWIEKFQVKQSICSVLGTTSNPSFKEVGKQNLHL